VVVELVTGAVTTAGAGTSTTAGAGAGTVSTTGAGTVVSSIVLWYAHPATIPHAAMAAGIIAILLINLIFVTSIGYIPRRTARSRPHRDFVEFVLVWGVEGSTVVRKSFRVADLTAGNFG